MAQTPLLGETLKALRGNHGLRHEDIAERVRVTRQQSMRWEAGENQPSPVNAFGLEELYGLERGLVTRMALAEEQLAEARMVASRLPALEELLADLRDAVRGNPGRGGSAQEPQQPPPQQADASP